MGLLTVGTLLNWEKTKKHAQLLRNKGAAHFINVHNTWLSTPETSAVKWGDEVEYQLIKFDHEAKRCYLLLKNEQLLPLLTAPENRGDENFSAHWHFETCRYMIEGISNKTFEFGLINIYFIILID